MPLPKSTLKRFPRKTSIVITIISLLVKPDIHFVVFPFSGLPTVSAFSYNRKTITKEREILFVHSYTTMFWLFHSARGDVCLTL